jgi:hypothetical protein
MQVSALCIAFYYINKCIFLNLCIPNPNLALSNTLLTSSYKIPSTVPYVNPKENLIPFIQPDPDHSDIIRSSFFNSSHVLISCKSKPIYLRITHTHYKLHNIYIANIHSWWWWYSILKIKDAKKADADVCLHGSYRGEIEN